MSAAKLWRAEASSAASAGRKADDHEVGVADALRRKRMSRHGLHGKALFAENGRAVRVAGACGILSRRCVIFRAAACSFRLLAISRCWSILGGPGRKAGLKPRAYKI